MEELYIRYLTDYPLCNYSCEYCVAGHATPSAAAQWDGDRYRRILANVARLPFMVRIRIGVGGEFFLDRQLVDGARELSHAENVRALNLITNLSLPWEQYERMLEGFRLDKVAVVASFHPSQVKDHEAWLETAQRMAKCVDFCTLLVAYPPFLDELTGRVEWLRRNGIDTFVQPFIGEILPATPLDRFGARLRKIAGMHRKKRYPSQYTKEEHDLVRRVMYSEHDIDYLLDLKKPDLCNAGYRAVFVKSSGLVYRCGGGTHAESIGDLLHGTDIRLADGPRPCPFAACQCDTDIIHITEFADRYRLTGINQHKYEPLSKPRP